MIRGITGIALEIVTFVWRGITLVPPVFLFAAYPLIDGVMGGPFAKGDQRRMAAHCGGIASILFGFPPIHRASHRGGGGCVLGGRLYTFILGVLLVSLGFKLRSWGHDLTCRRCAFRFRHIEAN